MKDTMKEPWFLLREIRERARKKNKERKYSKTRLFPPGTHTSAFKSSDKKK